MNTTRTSLSPLAEEFTVIPAMEHLLDTTVRDVM